MTDPAMWTSVSLAALAGVSVVATTCLKGWRDWIALQRAALEGRRDPAGSPPPAARIELADLRERVRKLEAIAAGVEL